MIEPPKTKIDPRLRLGKASPEITSDETLLEIIKEIREIEAMGISVAAETSAPPPPRPVMILAPTPKGTPAADRVLGAARIRCETEANSIMHPDSRRSGALALADKIEGAALATAEAGEFELGTGGELVPNATPTMTTAHYRNTVLAPSYVTAEASRARLDLADQCGVLETTLDISDTIEARDSTERMLAGQMALLHKVTMLAGKRAAESLEYMNGVIDTKYRETHSVQANRMVNSLARASAEFQNAMLTLQKVRSGGKQNITVTHAHVQNTTVNDGGQAVVTAGGVPTRTGADQ